MKRRLFLAAVLACQIIASLSGGSAIAQTKEVTIVHLDMLLPFRVAQVAGVVEKATGYKINWKRVPGSIDTIRAMANNEAQIGEVGSSGATVAAAQGMDIQVVWILDDINTAEQLVVSEKSGIRTLADLKGRVIATPFVSTAHYQLMFALLKANLNPRDVQIVNMRPAEIATAWERGEIDGAFIWDPVMAKLKNTGARVLVSAHEVAKQGAPTFDALMVNREWAEKNKEFVSALVREIAKADADYKANTAQYAAGSDNARVIARLGGAEPADVPAMMTSYGFVPATEQASVAWLGGGKNGGVAKAMATTAAFLRTQGRVLDIPEDFSKFVNPEYAAAAAK